MTKEQRRAARAAFFASFGASRFDEDDVQRDLGFNKSGDVIFDRLFEPPIEYVFPSVDGSALFFDGAFEAGEIALVNMLLSRDREPVVFDVGAGVGVHAVAWGAAHVNARVYAFETSLSDIDVLSRNAARVGERIVVVPKLVTATHDGDAVSIDAFVGERELSAISAIRIRVASGEAGIIEGARATLERDRPTLLVAFGRGREDGSAEDTIAAIVALGYKAFMIVDGFVAGTKRSGRAFGNYLFVDARKRVMLPPFPGPESLLTTTIARIEKLSSLEERLAGTRSRADGGSTFAAEDDALDRLRARDDKIKELENVCDERSRVIGELNFALTRERRAAKERAEVGAIQELTDQAGALREICEERQAVIDRLVAETAEQRSALDDEIATLRAACDERAAVIDRLADDLRSANGEAEAARLEALEERHATIERLSSEISTLRAACDERATLIEQLAQDLRSANAAAEAARLEVMEREAAAEFLGPQSLTAHETIETLRLQIEALATF